MSHPLCHDCTVAVVNLTDSTSDDHAVIVSRTGKNLVFICDDELLSVEVEHASERGAIECMATFEHYRNKT